MNVYALIVENEEYKEVLNAALNVDKLIENADYSLYIQSDVTIETKEELKKYHQTSFIDQHGQRHQLDIETYFQ